MKRFFNRLGIFIENKHILIFIISLVLILPSIVGAMRLEMKTGNETFVSTDSQVYKDFDRFNQNFSSDTVLILLTGEDLSQLLQPETVASMGTLEDEMNGNEQVVSAVGPAFMIKQALARQGEEPELPDTPAEIQDIVVDESGEIRDDFRHVFPDNKHAFIAVTLDGKLLREEQEDVIGEVEEAIDAVGFEEGIEPVVTGMPVFLKEMTEAQSESMMNMLLLSIGLMLVVLALIFSVRGFFAWRWLPLGAVLIAIVYSFGAMGVLSIPITMVTMAAFPILIGLGVDYAIQFHNRYDEEARRGETVAAAIIDSVTHIGPTIGIAIIAACLGFAALFFSPVPMIQDFGLTLIIGVVAAYLLSMFFLLATLYWHDRRNGLKAKSSKRDNKRKQEKKGMHIVDRALHRLAPRVIKNPAIILPIALVLCVGGIIADEHIDTETNVNNFVSDDMQAVKDLHLAEDVLGGVNTINLFVEAEDVTDPAVLAWMVQLEQLIGEDQPDVIADINSVTDLVAADGTIPQDSNGTRDILADVPPQIRRNLITDEYNAANIILTLPELSAEQSQELEKELAGYVMDDPPDGVQVTVTGNEVFKVELLDALTSGRMEMTIIGIVMVFLGLFLLFKFRILRALIAILPVGMILGWSSGVMYLMGIKYTPVTATLGALIIGIGVEFTILLMMRYYEERDKGEGAVEAMITAVTRIGRAVIASGFTVIGGFAALLIARDFPILQDFGVVTLINVFFALISTLLVLPTLIVMIDRWRERPGGRKISESDS